MRIAIIGALPLHKGLTLVLDTVEHARRRRTPLDVILLGWVPGRDPDDLPFSVSGPYREDELDALIARTQPDAIWFPSRAPETFSYTLSAAIRTDRPIVAPRVGAFSERLERDPAALLYPWDIGPEAMLDTLARAAQIARRSRTAPKLAAYYRDAYLSAPTARGIADAPVVTYETRSAAGGFDPCAYIRVRLPLRHPAAGIGRVVSLRDGVLPTAARLVVVQRTSIRDEQFAEDLIAWCRRADVPLVYETDDDLFGIPESHPEYDHYRDVTAAALRIARVATAITTSTRPLADALTAVNARVVVLENALDERLWFEEPVVAAASAPKHARILYMGTFSHGPDIALLRDAARRLQERGVQVGIDVVGIVPHDEPWFRRVDVPAVAGASYPAFVRWLRSEASRWIAGVAPLIENTFNEAKSSIKAYDYGALGLPLIASDVRPYRELAERGFPIGALVTDDAASWEHAIGTLVAAPRRAHELGAHARSWIREHATLGSVAPERRHALEELVNTSLEVHS